MDIRNPKELKTFASQRLETAREEKRIVLIYAAIIVALGALVTVINYVTGLEISQSGGLSNLGRRSFLSTLQSVFPMIQSFLLLFLDVGYVAAMLRIARGQYSSPNTLRLGFDRFWVLLRYAVAKTLIYAVLVFAGIYLGIILFMVSPLSNGTMELLAPYLEGLTVLDSSFVLDEAVAAQLSKAVIPAYVLCGGIVGVLIIPVMYSYRMAQYVIIDHPAMGAMAALRESKKMMRGKRLLLFKLDVSMWWYYAAMAFAYVVCYGDVILNMLGVNLPWHEDISYFIFYVLYLAVLFAVTYLLRNRVEVTYGLAYDVVKPEEKQDNSVVLGNIFQM